VAGSSRKQCLATAAVRAPEVSVADTPVLSWRAAVDFKKLKEDPVAAQTNADNRAAVCDINKVVQLYDAFQTLNREVDELRELRNQNSSAMKGKLEPDKRAALIQEGKDLKEKLSAIEGTLQALEYEMQTEGQKVPNDTHPAVPIGGEELAVLRKEVGAQRNFSFEAASHVDIGERLGMFDFETGGKVCGSRFVYLTGAGAMLELALINWAMAKVVSKGFKPMVVPDLVRQQVRVGAFPNLTHTVPVSPHKTETFLFQKQTMEKCGFQPRAENTQVYNIEGTDLCLAGTAEILLGGVYMDEVVAEKDLPIKMAAFSHCFRTEAGAAGSATRGLYRLHQFSKVEMFVIATPEQSDALHDELTEIEQEMYTELGFHFKVLDMSSQDLGAPAYRKFDIEAWMPALGRYGEISSASNCTDYQARRLNIKFRPEAVDGKKQPLKHVHTLNATACAVPRMIITILENFQNEDGSVDVPAPLQPFMGGVTKLTPEVVDAKKEGK
jgi:seryl-tRNA synthetase|tara:strand:+ start:6821 stop:8311 length:1491 start_codon:yes stop_codon:yes gene_type:complete